MQLPNEESMNAPRRKTLAVLVLLCMVATTPVQGKDAALPGPNPVQKVVNMLNMMQKNAQKEQSDQTEIFDKYMCFVTKQLKDLKTAIDDAAGSITQTQGSITQNAAKKDSLEADIKEAREDKADADETVKTQTALREKEERAFKASDAENSANIHLLGKAISKFGSGASSFVQLGSAATSTIQKLIAASVDLSSSDREVVTNFISESSADQDGNSDGFSQSSPAEIVGILKQMKDSMTEDQNKARADEKKASDDCESTLKSKNSQITTLRERLRELTKQLSEVGEQLVKDRAALTGFEKKLKTDEESQKNKQAASQAARVAYDLETKMRAEETVAIGETMQFLNDDASSRLLKNTMPSFLQLKTSRRHQHMRRVALQTLQKALPHGKHDSKMDFVALALSNKKTSFTKVKQMIDNMVRLLNQEMVDDQEKKGQCTSDKEENEDSITILEQTSKDLGTDRQKKDATLKEEEANLKEGVSQIAKLDSQVKQARETRIAENQEFQSIIQQNNAAQQILKIAMDRLSAFYDRAAAFAQVTAQSKKQVAVAKTLKVKAIATEEPSEKQAASLSESGKESLSALFDDDTLSFVQVDTQNGAPEYKAASADREQKDGNAVMKLIKDIVADIAKEVAEQKKGEAEAQQAYEAQEKDASAQRENFMSDVTDATKNKAKAEVETQTNSHKQKSTNKKLEMAKTMKKDLEADCDEFLKQFEARKKGRSNEIDALKSATNTLNNADFDSGASSAIQTDDKDDSSLVQVHISKRTWKGLRAVNQHK